MKRIGDRGKEMGSGRGEGERENSQFFIKGEAKFNNFMVLILDTISQKE